MVREQIEEKLRIAFKPVFLEVVDESYRHNVSAGSENHFKVVLVSDRFTGERFLNCHRIIYSTLTAELSTTVHALVLHTCIIKEWEALQDTVFVSPPCRGAGSIVQKRTYSNRRFSSVSLQIMWKRPASRLVSSEFWGSRTIFRQKLAGNCEKSRNNAR